LALGGAIVSTSTRDNIVLRQREIFERRTRHWLEGIGDDMSSADKIEFIRNWVKRFPPLTEVDADEFAEQNPDLF
jgi:hypothetical protein